MDFNENGFSAFENISSPARNISNETIHMEIRNWLMGFKIKQTQATEARVFALLCLYFILIVIGLAGNLGILRSIYIERRASGTMNPILFNLCISDLTVVSLCCPITMYATAIREWTFGQTACCLSNYLQGVTVTLETYSMTALSVDRYFLVRRPSFLKHLSRQKMGAYVVTSLWAFSTLISAPLLLVRKVHQLELHDIHVEFCIENWSSDATRRLFAVVTFLLVYFLPCAILVVCHSTVARSLTALDNSPDETQEQKKRGILRLNTRRSLFSSQRNSTLASTSEPSDAKPTSDPECSISSTRALRQQIAKVLMAMTLVFVACWLPYNLVSFFADLFQLQALVDSLPYTLFFGHAHSALNPIVYWLLTRNMSRASS